MNEAELKIKYDLKGSRKQVKRRVKLIRQLEAKKKVINPHCASDKEIKRLMRLTGYFDQA